LYIEENEGWKYFSITQHESEGEGARQEFHRRVMAFRLRELKEEIAVDAWAALRFSEPELLADLLPGGRGISWDEIDTAEYPIFGARLRLGQRVKTRRQIARHRQEMGALDQLMEEMVSGYESKPLAELTKMHQELPGACWYGLAVARLLTAMAAGADPNASRTVHQTHPGRPGAAGGGKQKMRRPEIGETLYRCGYALGGRSKCKTCGEKIEQAGLNEGLPPFCLPSCRLYRESL
jgi:hypothetical protein